MFGSFDTIQRALALAATLLLRLNLIPHLALSEIIRQKLSKVYMDTTVGVLRLVTTKQLHIIQPSTELLTHVKLHACFPDIIPFRIFVQAECH